MALSLNGHLEERQLFSELRAIISKYGANFNGRWWVSVLESSLFGPHYFWDNELVWPTLLNPPHN